MKLVWIILIVILIIFASMGIWACNIYDSNICHITYQFFESNFIISLMGAGFGASIGALAAQQISTKSKLSEITLSQFKESNAATIVSISILNQAISAKKYFIKPAYDNYYEVKNVYHEQIFARKKGNFQSEDSENKKEMIEIDLRKLHLSPMPVEFLHNQIIGKIELSGSTLMILFELVTVNKFLEHLLETRNNYISEHHKKYPPQQQDKVIDGLKVIFGEPGSEDKIKVAFNSYNDNMMLFIDEIIKFSYQLTQSLIKHTNELGLKYRTLGNKEPLSFHNMDFSSYIDEGLIPNEILNKDN